MKKVSLIFFVASVFLAVFGYWGAYTESGRANFDEMAGMIPFFSALFAVVFFLFSLIFFVMFYFKRK